MEEEEIGTRAQKTMEERLRHRRMTTGVSLPRYLWQTLCETSLWGLWRQALDWFRRFRLVALLFRIAALLWAILQTGAAVIFSTVLFLIALPLLASLMLGILLTALIESKKSNRRLLRATEGRTVYVLFLPRTEHSLLGVTARELSSRENVTVIAVSPYWISSRGLSEGRFYCTVRREAPSLYLLRRFYFFSFCKHVLSKRKTAYLF